MLRLRNALDDKTLEVLELQSEQVQLLAQLRREIRERDESIDRLQHELRGVHRAPVPSASLLMELQTECRELRGRLAVANGTVAERDRELNEVRGHVADLRERSGALRSQMDALLAGRHDTSSQLDDARTQLASVRRELQHRTAQVNDLAARLHAAETREAHTMAALDAHVATGDELNHRMMESQGEIERLRATVNVLEGRHTALTDATADAQERELEARAQLADGAAMVVATAAATDRLRFLESETTRLQSALETMDTAHSAELSLNEREKQELSLLVEGLQYDLDAATSAWRAIADERAPHRNRSSSVDSLDTAPRPVSGNVSAMSSGKGSGARSLQMQCESLSRTLTQLEGMNTKQETEKRELLRVNDALRRELSQREQRAATVATATVSLTGLREYERSSEAVAESDVVAAAVLRNAATCEGAWLVVSALINAALGVHAAVRSATLARASPWLDDGVAGGSAAASQLSTLSFRDRFDFDSASGAIALAKTLAAAERRRWIDVASVEHSARQAADLLVSCKADIQEYAAVRLGQQCVPQ